MQLVLRAEEAYLDERYPDAKRWFIAAVRRNPTDANTIYNLACCLALLKEKDLALKCLATAWVTGFHDLDHIRRDPDFDGLREDPAFRRLIGHFEVDLERSRAAQLQRMQAYLAWARMQQAQAQQAQARSWAQSVGGGGSGGSGGSGGGSSTWRSNVSDTGISSDGDFIGVVGRGWSVCVGN
jgi:hypothetical protein